MTLRANTSICACPGCVSRRGRCARGVAAPHTPADHARPGGPTPQRRAHLRPHRTRQRSRWPAADVRGRDRHLGAAPTRCAPPRRHRRRRRHVVARSGAALVGCAGTVDGLEQVGPAHAPDPAAVAAPRQPGSRTRPRRTQLHRASGRSACCTGLAERGNVVLGGHARDRHDAPLQRRQASTTTVPTGGGNSHGPAASRPHTRRNTQARVLRVKGTRSSRPESSITGSRDQDRRFGHRLSRKTARYRPTSSMIESAGSEFKSRGGVPLRLGRSRDREGPPGVRGPESARRTDASLNDEPS